MTLLEWMISYLSDRNKANSLYRRGMSKAKKHNHQGAIEDYTMALGVPDTPSEMRAMILYNRGLVHVAAGMASEGADDLNAVLAMDEVAPNVKTAAERKLSRIKARKSKRIA
ncbi:hypothetical protein [Bremerella sp. P1]|uniref:hypothetical protein n=1 Tax=Bremerella sp. P1 TaxID=3026424 RepID=UPI0023685BC5|nr:hypothetical protein [Bremerella sp. P1]WDI40550.1 hypothetical protein PSR63_18915 [Bremerella sp. P1]